MRCSYTDGETCWLKIMHGPANECKDECKMSGNDDDKGSAA